MWRNLTIPEQRMPKFYPIDKQAGNPCGPFLSFGLPGGAAAWRTPATKNTPNLRFGVFSKSLIGTVAVTVGFEPTLAFTPNNISSVAPSAARTRHRGRVYATTGPRANRRFVPPRLARLIRMALRADGNAGPERFTP